MKSESEKQKEIWRNRIYRPLGGLFFFIVLYALFVPEDCLSWFKAVDRVLFWIKDVMPFIAIYGALSTQPNITVTTFSFAFLGVFLLLPSSIYYQTKIQPFRDLVDNKVFVKWGWITSILMCFPFFIENTGLYQNQVSSAGEIFQLRSRLGIAFLSIQLACLEWCLVFGFLQWSGLVIYKITSED